MTRRGIIYSVILLFLLIISYGTGIKELFMISYCMLMLLAFSLVSVLLANVTVFASTEISDKDVIRNDKAYFTVKLKGFVLLPFTGDIYITVPGKRSILIKDAENHVFCRLPGLCKKDFLFTLNCDNKGIWYIGIKKLRVHDVFGLFSIPLFFSLNNMRKKYELKIHPRCYDFDFEKQNPPSNVGMSSTVNNESDTGDSVSGSRQYRYGDPFKRINWKQTARTHTVYVRNYELEQISQVLIMLDNSSYSDTQQNADIAGDICASLNKYYIKTASAVKNQIIRINTKKAIRDIHCTVRNDNDYIRLNNDLISIRPYVDKKGLNIPVEKIVQIGNYNVVHLITSSPTKELLEHLSKMNKSGYIINCIVPVVSEEAKIQVEQLSENIAFKPILISQMNEASDLLGGRL